MKAFYRIVASRTSQYPPTVGELRRAVTQARYPSLLILPEEAWGEVWTGVTSKGLNNQPEWSHPALAAAVESVGWREICLCDRGNLGTLRAQFMKIYEAKRAAAETEEATPVALRIAKPKPENERLTLGHATAKVEKLPAPEAPEVEVGSEEGWKRGLSNLMAAIAEKKEPLPEPPPKLQWNPIDEKPADVLAMEG